MARLYRLDNNEPLKGEQLRKLALSTFRNGLLGTGELGLANTVVGRPNTVGKAVWLFAYKLNKKVYTKLESESIWQRIYSK